MFTTLFGQIGAAAMAAACILALASRGRAQVITALIVAAAWIGSAALQDRANTGPLYWVFALDIAIAVVFVGLALWFRQAWLMWVAAFQLLTAATHVAVIVDLRIDVRAYITAYTVWSYALLLALAWGGIDAFRARARRR
ncbi:hypothetical protein [Caulobacter mirabilis]|uniref:hypothetical protein n=1 Tax=Caulobacter mirabilis TaxID=69666 RepID=UPI0012373BE5|nr:hypothetical protein [Caulobacter mirabilis]